MAFARTAATAALRNNVCRQCPQSTRSFTQIATAANVQRVKPAFTTAVRWHSVPAGSTKVYDFSQVQKLSESPSADIVLVDVREPSEYQAGYIPNAINLPIKSQPDALLLPEEEFEDRFGFEKPALDKEVVFYCKAGVRSSAAAQLAQQHGYQNIAEYRGSWMDWEKNGGSTSKP
ncbi:Putative Rhodanese-like domain-containing protein [Septoria linicola]|uniref:Rhodanese-like domain-containing protein n=1 Tax=Septoria linicola TaxID=215465 RepID=A0A9Q9ALA7_9PEZI|nr:putative Rhodanese-like domain-containing protein [Septoria linicola]USW50109.1 Putative Rhodanese-like domain-containing protein [Septoria linicola]